MINVPAGARILLATQPIDFRKGAHGLAALAQEVLGENPFSGTVIVYRSKRSDRVKILVWDTSGRNCSTRLNDSFPVQDSVDCLVGVKPASCCRANDGSDGGEQISTPV